MFKEDDAVNVSSPMALKYIKLLRGMMRIISAWPGKELKEDNLYWFEGVGYTYYITSLAMMYMTMGTVYLILHMAELSFFELGHMYIVLLMNLVSISRGTSLCLRKTYRNLAKEYVQSIHLFYHKDKSEYAMEIHQKVHKFCHIFTIYSASVMFFALGLFNMTPVYNNYAAGKYKVSNLVNTTYEHAIYLAFPFNSDSNFNGYMLASAINWTGSYLCASSVCMFDLFLSLMIFSLWGHFKILLHLLDHFPRPAAEKRMDINVFEPAMYTELEQEMVAVKLKECIEYHRLIVNFTNKMSSAFGLALFAYYTFHQISGCLLLLECSQMNPQALARYVPFTVVMFQQLIQLSIIFETIGTMSAKLKDAVYCLPWESMNTRNRKTVYIYLINVQEPIHIHAGGLVTVGVTTMASIIKTSFSYFAFLRTTVQ